MLGVERDGRALLGLAVHDVVPPDVAAVLHGRPALDRIAQPPDDEHVLDGRGRQQRLVDGRLEGRRLAPPPAAVRGDDQLRLRVVDAIRERLGAEAAEDDRVRCSEARAGQHRDRQLRDHRHVDRDAIAGPDAQLLERVGRLADLAQEVGVGQRARVAGLADPVVGDLVAKPVARRGGPGSCS